MEEVEQIALEKEVAVRYKDAPWNPIVRSLHLTIGGVGGIGSYLSFLLGRMGFNLVLYDFDKVSDENMGVQFFMADQLGSHKVTAIYSILSAFDTESSYRGNIDVNTHFLEMSYVTKMCFSCFDNMHARKLMFNNWILYCKNNPTETKEAVFFDLRMGAENFEIYVVPYEEEKIEKYKKSLFDDSELPDLQCTFKATPFTPFTLTGIATSIFVNFLSNICTGEDFRIIPYRVEFHSAIQHFEYEY